MDLSNELISQFVKITNDKPEPKKETTVYGTTVVHNNVTYVKLDGSELLTPVTSTADTQPGERVTVMIKNHTATITGNISSPAARTDDLKNVAIDTSDNATKISEFEIAIGAKADVKDLTAANGRIDELVADNVAIKQNLATANAEIDILQANEVTINQKLNANEASIENLETTKLDAKIAEAQYATIENLEATNADVNNLEATYANFEVTATNKFEAIEAEIAQIEAGGLTVEQLEAKFANIDFSNISEAAMEYFYAQSGLIENVTIGDGTITGELVGVTIKGDLIEGSTIKAEKLVIKGTDGLYYKLNTDGVTTEAEQTDQNSLDGSVIRAKTITASKIDVDDLVAFDATIGGFHITKNSIYSAVKSSVDNTTRGLYMDTDGQFAFGNANDYLKFFKDTDGTYKLVISASDIILNSSDKSVETALSEVQSSVNNLNVGGRNLLKNSRHITMRSNNTVEYPITTEVMSDVNREFTRYRRDSVDINPTAISLYSVIPVLDVTEHLTGKEMTFSFLIRCSHETTTTLMGLLVVDGTTRRWASNTQQYSIGTEWKRISLTATIEIDYAQNETNLLRFNPQWVSIPEGEIENFYIDVCEWKIEKGNKATDWTPAPEDLEARVDTAETQITQNAEGITEVMTRTTNNETAITTLEKTADGLTVRMSNAETDIQDASKTATNFIEASTAGVVIGDMTAETLGRNVHIDTDSVDIRKGDIVLASYGDNEVYIGKNNRESKLDLCNGVAKLYNSTSDNPDLTYNKLWIEAEHAIELNTEHLIGLYSNFSETERAGIDIKSSLPWSDTSTQIDPKVVIRAEDTPVGSSYIETHARQIELSSIGDSNENGANIRLDGVAGRVHIGEATNEVYMHPNVYFKSSPILENNTPFYAKNTGNNPIDILHLSTGGNCVLGYGAYNDGKNAHIYGNDIVLFSKEANANVRPYYRPGDSFTIDIYTAGYVTNSSTEVWFTLPLSKPVIGVTTITLSSVSGFVLRQNGLYTHGSTLSSFCNPASYKAYLHASQEGIRVKATFNYTDNAVNNSPIGIRWSGEITFS